MTTHDYSYLNRKAFIEMPSRERERREEKREREAVKTKRYIINKNNIMRIGSKNSLVDMVMMFLLVCCIIFVTSLLPATDATKVSAAFLPVLPSINGNNKHKKSISTVSTSTVSSSTTQLSSAMSPLSNFATSSSLTETFPFLSIASSLFDGVDDPTAFSSSSSSSDDVLSPVVIWTLRIVSAFTSYFGLIGYSDRPRGELISNDVLQVKQSLVVGAGLGLFVGGDDILRKGTILGTYPGIVVPLQPHLSKLKSYPECEIYIWRFSDSQMVIDPTNSIGILDDICIGGNPNQFCSELFFQTIGKYIFQPIPTMLCRINEPPKGKDVNVITDEDRNTRTVTFSLERDVYPGEELFIDYGLTYDRSNYG